MSKIAEAFGKRTSDLKRLIRKLPCPKHFSERNFTLTSYIDKQGKQRPMYEITKDGFVLLVMGFTGERAIEFKIRYIEALMRWKNIYIFTLISSIKFANDMMLIKFCKSVG